MDSFAKIPLILQPSLNYKLKKTAHKSRLFWYVIFF